MLCRALSHTLFHLIPFVILLRTGEKLLMKTELWTQKRMHVSLVPLLRQSRKAHRMSLINFCWLNDSPDSHLPCSDEETLTSSSATFNMARPLPLFSFPCSATGTQLCPTIRRPILAPSVILSQSYSSWMMPRCRWRSCSMNGRLSWTSSCNCASLSSTPLRYGGREGIWGKGKGDTGAASWPGILLHLQGGSLRESDRIMH